MSAPPPSASDYRFARAVVARLVGGLLVLLALLVAAATLLVAALGLSAWILAAVAMLAAVIAGGGALALMRVPVVHLGPEDYRIRWVRGAGVVRARWTEVTEAVTATPQGLPVVVLKLTDERTTTIPVTVLAADREQFVRDLQGHLQRGQGLRPLT